MVVSWQARLAGDIGLVRRLTAWSLADVLRRESCDSGLKRLVAQENDAVRVAQIPARSGGVIVRRGYAGKPAPEADGVLHVGRGVEGEIPAVGFR